MIKWREILAEAIVNCIRTGDFHEEYDDKDGKCFELAPNAQRYLANLREKYMQLNEALNGMEPDDFDEEDNDD